MVGHYGVGRSNISVLADEFGMPIQNPECGSKSFHTPATDAVVLSLVDERESDRGYS